MSDTVPFKGLMGHYVTASPVDAEQGTRQGWVVSEDPPTIRCHDDDFVCEPECSVVTNPPTTPGLPIHIRRDDYRDLRESFYEMCDQQLERLLNDGASKVEVYALLCNLKGQELNGRIVRWTPDDDSEEDGADE